MDHSEPVTVVVAEDEVLVRMLLADALREEGFKVIEAINAEEALIALEATPDVRCLITDVAMGGQMDGLTLCRLVAQTWPEMGLVIASAFVLGKEDQAPPKAHILEKPYDMPDLIEAVWAAIDEKVTPSVDSVAAPAPSTVTVNPVQADLGSAGGLAQPTPEPED